MEKNKLPTRIYLADIKKDLEKKMVFLGGPRQVGKTTLSTSLIANFKDGHPGYLNWDLDADRKTILSDSWSKEEPLIIFDEIHKYKTWQRLVKGIWDKWKNTQKFIITGSARLDTFRKGGDSMLGRYHYYRIHPYTLPELGLNEENLKILFQFGGFPEPLIDRNEKELRRWHLQRVSKIVRVDIRDLENITDIDKVEVLADTLSQRVGSLLSYKSLAEDLEKSDKTIKKWIQILDSLYYCYLIHPYGSSKIKAIKKTPKLYLWDWSQVEDEAARFENFVASHLLKWCDYMQDAEGFKTELRFIRDETGKECDFVVLKSGKPLFAVECKLNDNKPSESFTYFKNKLISQIPYWYQVTYNQPTKVIEPNVKSLSFIKFCEELKLK